MASAKLIFTMLVFFPFITNAEYRVFSIVINNNETKVVRQVETTLDPQQYMTLYPLNRQESIYYVDTWMCRGRTDFFKPNCSKPPKQAPNAPSTDVGRVPASTQSPELR